MNMKKSDHKIANEGNHFEYLINKNNSVSLFLQNISDIRYIRPFHFLFLALMLFLRRPDALLNAQPWAEDGSLFLQQAMEHSFNSLFIPYAGYLHIIPRLVTLISLQFGFMNAPLIMNASALFISSLCVSYFFNADFRFIIRNDFLRLICTILIICPPSQQFYDIYLNITNIQWFLSIFIALWIIKFIFKFNSLTEKNKISSFKEILCIIFLSLSFLTAPLSFIMIPFLIIAYIYKIKSKEFSNLDIIVYLIPIIFVLIHVIICASSKTSSSLEFPSFFQIFISSQIASDFFYNELVAKFGFLLVWLLVISSLVISVVSISKKNQFFLDIIVLLMVFMSIFYIILGRANTYPPETIMTAGRYIIFSFTFFLIFLFRQINTFDKKPYFNILLLVILIFISINFTQFYNMRPFDDCNFKLDSKYYDPNGQYSCNIPINPTNPPWSMNIPCNQSRIILFPGSKQDPKDSNPVDISIYRPKFTTQLPDQLCYFSQKTILGANNIIMFQHALNNNYVYFNNIKIPENSKLSISIALDPRVWDPDKGDGVLFELYVNETNRNHKIFSHYIDPKNNLKDRKWNEFEIDLSKFANEQITLIFSTQPGPINDDRCDLAWWGNGIISKK
jgi:hypothetical protein